MALTRAMTFLDHRAISRPVITGLLGILLVVPASQLDAQEITFSGDPGLLTIQFATAGYAPDPASDVSTAYTVTTIAPQQRIVARLDAPLPSGVSLTIALTPPVGVASTGDVVLSTVDQTVVASIPTAGTYSGLAVTYRLSASTAAGPVPTDVRSVVFTVVSVP